MLDINTITVLTATVHPLAAHVTVLADGGIFGTLTNFTNSGMALLKLVGVAVVLGAFLYFAHKRGWGLGALVMSFIIAGLIFWGMNGGLQWLGTQIQATFQA